MTTEAQRELLRIKPSLAELARVAGCSRMSASRYMRGEDRPEQNRREAIADFYGVPSALWGFNPADNEARRVAIHGLQIPDEALRARLRATPPGDAITLAALVRQRADLGLPPLV